MLEVQDSFFWCPKLVPDFSGPCGEVRILDHQSEDKDNKEHNEKEGEK